MLYKYPHTPHLPFSPGVKNDDTVIESLNGLIGEIIVTEKMDGENTSFYRDHIHARSMDSRHHLSRDWVKSFWGQIKHQIPEGWRICGENLYAKHTLPYDKLPSYFLGFSVWDDRNVSLSWDETLVFFDDLGIASVPELYRGPFNIKKLHELVKSLDLATQEGIVVRLSSEIEFDKFHLQCAKWVRKGHVQTDEHWMHGPVIPNKLKVQP